MGGRGEMNAPDPAPENSADVKPLGVAATLGWALLVFLIAQAAGAAVVLAWPSIRVPTSISGISYDGALIALVTLIINPVQIVLLLAIVRWRTAREPMEYLGLVGFTLRDFLVGVIAMAALVAAIDGASRLAGLEIVPPFETDILTSGRAEGWLVPILLAIVVIGPAGEEIMFRGFLFRGWVSPGLRGVAAVVVITLLWSVQHIQYDWFGISQVFVTGLLLGWIRWRSGSTSLTILLHMLVNLDSTVETIVKLGWM
jgi:uncharacterized protein